MLRSNLDFTKVTAPIDGRQQGVDLNGGLVTAGDTQRLTTTGLAEDGVRLL